MLVTDVTYITPVGVLGAYNFVVTDDDAADELEVPPAFVAVTVNV